MNKIILFCSLLTISFSAMSEPQPWMKQEDPNSLGLYVMVNHNCPFKKSDLMKLAEGEYLRARIKPTTSMEKLNIIIYAMCLPINEGTGKYKEHRGYTMASSIDFSIRMVLPVTGYVSYTDSIGYRGLLVSGSDKSETKTYFLTSIRESLSDALTDYLKANME